MKDFCTRLSLLMAQGNLTVSDLAMLLRTPDGTVRGWIQDGRYPRLTPQDFEDVSDRLSTLESLVKGKKELPIPRCSRKERQAHLRGLVAHFE